MSFKNKLQQEFISHCQLEEFNAIPLKHDASARRYTRLTRDLAKYILMDSSQEIGSVQPFVKTTNFLLTNEFSVPEIFVTDSETGFLLLEDLGDITFNNYLKENPDAQNELYKLALDILIKISQIKTSDLDFPTHDKQTLLEGLKLFQKYYLKNDDSKFIEICNKFLDQLNYEYNYLELRDYHADNLMILPNRGGINKIGILDYQDASLGFLAYDLTSLIQDARRWIEFEDQDIYYDYFISNIPNLDKEEFRKEYDILSFQRNARIVGLFTKFAEEGKPEYLDYLKNVHRYIAHNLESPYLKEMHDYLASR